MSLVKRLTLLSGLALAIVVGLSSSSEAQFRRGRTVFVGGGGFYYADPFWYGYPWYPYSAYQYPIGRYPYGYRYAQPESAVRLDVTPKEAEVYVDGYYAGIVDDFDGVFQRLRVAPGDHELTLYHEGFQTVHQQLYLAADSTFKVKFTMEKLPAGAPAEPRPTPPPQNFAQAPLPGQGNPQQGPGPQGPGPQGPPPRGPVTRRAPVPLPPIQNGPASTATYGTLAVRVQPANATVIIDGERWEGPQGPERLMVELSEGPHRVQVQREGYDNYSSDVTIRRGETTPLNISLRTR